MNTNEKLYMTGVKAYLDQQPHIVTRLLKDSHLTMTEKALLQVRLYFNEKKWTAAQKLLENLEPETLFLKAERSFLLGNLFGFHANWEEAIIHNCRALKLYAEIHNRRGLFLTNYNLSVDYSAIGLHRIAQSHLNESQKYHETVSQHLQIIRAQACAAITLKNLKSALDYVDLGFSILDRVEPSERSMFLLIAAEVRFRSGHGMACYELLKELMYSKTIMDKGRVYFEFALMQKLLFDQPPYKRIKLNHDYLSFSKEYQLKLSICISLVENDQQKAESQWNDLCHAYPLIYTLGFKSLNSTEDGSIFMSFIGKFLQKESKDIRIQFQNKQSLLIKILSENPNGLRKQDIIEKIWNKKYEVVMDSRLYKLIQRVRDNSNYEIYNSNQSYYIKESS